VKPIFLQLLATTLLGAATLRAAAETDTTASAAPTPEELALAERLVLQEVERRTHQESATEESISLETDILVVEPEPAEESALHPGTPDSPATETQAAADPDAQGSPTAPSPDAAASPQELQETTAEIAAVEVDPAALPAEPEEPVWTVEPYAEADAAPLAAAAGGDAAAAEGAAPSAPPNVAAGSNVASTPTGNIVVNLINKLVERGVLTATDARTMVTQAQAEAEAQKVQNESDMFAIAQIAAVQTMTDQALAQQAGTSAVDASRREMEEDMRVTYIPAPVREQLAADIRRELAADGVSVTGGEQKPPPGLPALLAKLKPEGEIRFRYEADLYPSGNSDLPNAFVNFNAINTGSPLNILPSALLLDPPPQWNANQNRNRYRMLVRFGTGIELGDNFSAGIRVATGDNNSPVTANQSFGLANQGQGGQFSKYAIWLDRAFIRYDLGGGSPETGMLAVGAPYSMVGPGELGGAGMTLWFGRFDNPFFSTPIIFDNDLGFDGAAIRLTYNHEDIVIPSVVAGAFPVFNTDLNFSSNQAEKFPSYDKYLFAIQGGTQVNITRNWSTQVAAAYYSFYNIEGKLSSPYVQLSENDAGDTDNSRPSFAQKGNTYRTLRNLLVPQGQTSLPMDYQYFGLATPFQNLAFTGKLTYDGWDPVRVSLIGEYVRNVAFNSSAIDEVAVNNLGTDGAYEGDPNAWLIDLEAGHAELDKLGAWQFAFGYRWIGSDAVVDGFNDSDFGLGGTNMKGFTAAARLALSPHIYLALRWFGSESIAGPQFDMNIFQLDLGAKF
jgi:polyhydroxyalkanoate synthesis regulator phasin